MSKNPLKPLSWTWAKDSETGDRLESPLVSIEMAKAEGWLSKSGSKWKTMPELMLRYRAATFFGRLYAPEILMGMSTSEEAVDISSKVKPASNSLMDRFAAPKKSDAVDGEIVDAEFCEFCDMTEGKHGQGCPDNMEGRD